MYGRGPGRFASFSDKPSEDVTMYLSTGNTIYFLKDPRYGHWTAKLHAGQLPEALKGRFTHYEEIIRRANQVYNARGVTIHKQPQFKYSDIVNDVREEMGLERK